MKRKRSRQNIVSINNYNIDGSTLEEVEHHPYLGITSTGTTTLTRLPPKQLAFLRRNLNKCSKEVKDLPIAVLVVSVVEISISAPGASM
jgi:hypothetical protein